MITDILYDTPVFVNLPNYSAMGNITKLTYENSVYLFLPFSPTIILARFIGNV